MARAHDRRTLFLLLAVVPAAALGTLYQPRVAHSFPTYPPLLPNRVYAVDSSSTSVACITCHNNPDGGQGCIALGELAPCFNPFGSAFQAAGKVWGPALAALDSDGDGFTNGQELQDPTGSWLFGTAAPGYASYVTGPGSASTSPGFHDVDQDGFCWFGRDLNADRDCRDAGENTLDFDCDDARADVNPNAVEICTNAYDDDCNGLDTFHDPVCADVVDGDQDGYCPMGRDLNGDRDCLDTGEDTTDVDCDDSNLLVRPGAPENCVDGIDNDCDTDVDGGDPNCTGESDFDEDGYCPIGQDTNDDGDCLDLGESALPSDCNDQNALVNPGEPEVCGDLQDNDCDLIADFLDSDCASLADRDGDGFCPNGRDLTSDGDCADTGDALGPLMGFDCDDTNATVYSLAEEICLDAVDQDCDGQPALDDSDCVGFLDQDGDAYCPVGGIDLNDDGDCADTGEISVYSDCNDFSNSINPSVTEAGALCTNGVDDDCDGSLDASAGASAPNCASYADWDFDGYCAIGRDTNDDGDCADAGEQTADSDARPFDSSVSPGNHESCFDFKDNDQDGAVDLADSECVDTHDVDGDGYCPVGRDVNGDGDCADPGENYALSDCRDDDPNWGPHVREIFVADALVQRCFDYDDNDCDGQVDLADSDCDYVLDRDEDGVCGHGVDLNSDGDCLDLDEQGFGDDCDDDDPARASTYPEDCDNLIDDDCDGDVDAQDFACMCQLDSECPVAPDCQLARCMSGVCQNIADPACVELGGRDDSGCGVVAPAGSTRGRGSREALLCILAAAAAVILRRRSVSLRA